MYYAQIKNSPTSVGGHGKQNTISSVACESVSLSVGY